jgi:hypothetical protein
LEGHFIAYLSAPLFTPFQKHNISTSAADRIRIVGAALEQSLNHIGPDGQFTDSEGVAFFANWLISPLTYSLRRWLGPSWSFL